MTTINPHTDPSALVADTTTPRQWPGTTQWTDADYQQFVEQYAAGAFPDLSVNPTAWDRSFVPAGDPDAPNRPTLISRDDFDDCLPPCHHASYGLLVIKLWEVARAKGYTAALEEEYHRARMEQLQREEELRQQQLRGEIEALRPNLPAPEPATPVDPRQQWYAAIMAAILPDSSLIEKVKHVQQKVIEGQPFRNAILQESAADVLNSTFGPLMLRESADALAHPFPPLADDPEPEPVLKKWGPDATTGQIINGAARELSDLVCMLIARQRVSVGYEADRESVVQALKLTRSLKELSQVCHITALTSDRKRGRPPKPGNLTPNTKPAGKSNTS